MDDLLQDFLTETGENLEKVDLELVRFEQEPGNEAILRNIFRLVHTIKGTCGFLGLPRLEALTHAAETVMGHFRDGAHATPDAVSLVLLSIDRVKAILAELGRSGAEPLGNDNDLIGALDAIVYTSDASGSGHDADHATLGARSGKHAADELERAFLEADGPEIVAEHQPQVQPPAQAMASLVEVISNDGPHEAADETSLAAVQTLRVNVSTLEHLMTMVSELVLTRNQLLDIARRDAENAYKAPLQRLSTITAELQDGVMKTRMQPIGNAWSKLPRIMRDVSADLGKKINLVFNGAATELDRQVLELIKDPLTHMIRNSADHGIETPDIRRAMGKSEQGTITVSAFHEGGQITIEVQDDGQGLDLDRIRNKVIETGLASRNDIARMGDDQIAHFIFHPGLSTAEKITSISGRGVGMDVVKSNVDAIGGIVDISTHRGKGTTISVKIPLTLAIVSALIVLCGGQRFAIPQTAVRELVRARPGSPQRIEFINGAPVLRLRDRLLPLIAASHLMRLTKDPASEGFVVVAQVGTRQFGILVDAVLHTEEIVVKPMSAKLRHVQMFSGNTILGDGTVVMIIDPNGLSRMIGVLDTEGLRDDIAGLGPSNTATDHETMLVFRNGDGSLKAIPISLVTRLEEVDAQTIETSDGRAMLQYRGRLMPVIPLSSSSPIKSTGTQSLIIVSEGERSMGLAVDTIVDIVAEPLTIEMAGSAREGIAGTAIIRGRATDIIDLASLLPQAHPDWLLSSSPASGTASRQAVLLVDPSAFFRDMLVPVLKATGCKVMTAATGDEALAILASNPEISAAVIDIETMDGMGLKLARQLRQTLSLTGLPIVGLVTFASAALARTTHDLGIDHLVAKFDRKGLIAALTVLDGQTRAAA